MMGGRLTALGIGSTGSTGPCHLPVTGDLTTPPLFHHQALPFQDPGRGRGRDRRGGGGGEDPRKGIPREVKSKG